MRDDVLGLEKLPLSSLSVLQGDLKSLTEIEMEKLWKNITTKGFKAPFFVWKNKGKNWILDGTQRFHTLNYKKQKGAQLPETFPCLIIHADSEKEAKETILMVSSQFGVMSPESLSEFAISADIDMAWLEEHTRFAEVAFKDLTDNLHAMKINQGDENAEWANMPEFQPGDPKIRLSICFESEQSRAEFCETHDITVDRKMNGQWISYR